MEEREISLKELFLVVWKGKILIGIVTFVFLVVSFFGAMIYDNSSSEVGTIVTLQWSGIGQGEYPDGSRFDYGEAIEPYILTLAIDELDMELVTNDVRNSMSFTPIVPNDILSVIQLSLEEGEQITYFASDYMLVMNNGALEITVEEARELINEIVNQYRLDFERKFINQITVLDFTDADFDSYDYLDAYDILVAQMSAINNAMNARSASGFYSPTLGISFNDILVRTNLLSRIEYEQISSRVNTYLLTKDKDYLVTNYAYKNQLNQLELDKALVMEGNSQIMLDNYAGSVNTIIIPGLSDLDALEIDTYYNVLIANQITLQTSIANLEKDIEYNELLIDRLEGNDPLFTVTPQDQADEALIVEAHIASADAELEDIVNDSNILLSEYNDYITSNIIKPLMAPQYQSSVSKMLVGAVGLVLGAGIATVVVLFKHNWE